MNVIESAAQAFSRDYWGGDGPVLQSGGAQTVSSLMFAVPVLVGAFVGAPLIARELDSGTFRFAWTQGAGRNRWAISTLLFPALVLTSITGAFTALFDWYFRPFLADGQVSEMLPLAFALLGVAFAAWTLFALVTGTSRQWLAVPAGRPVLDLQSIEAGISSCSRRSPSAPRSGCCAAAPPDGRAG